MALVDNLQAYWKLDESSGNAADATSNGNTATNNNTVTYSSGKINNGAFFARASSQNLSAGDSTSLSIVGDISISFWLYFTTLPSSGQVYGLVTKDTAGTSGRSYWIDVYNPSASYQLRMGIHADGGSTNFAYSYVTHSFSTGTWYHVVAKCTPANAIATKFEFYVDGTSKGNGTAANNGAGATAIYDSTTATVLGGYASTGVYHNGGLDEVGIWDRILTGTEVTNLYNGGSGLSYDSFGGGGGTVLPQFKGFARL